MTNSAELQDLNILAKHLCYTKSGLLTYLYSNYSKYRKFTIPKKNGGEREILAPTTKLRQIQSDLAKLLNVEYKPKSSAHGYVPGKSIVTNARCHCAKKIVVNIDIKDFFPSITFPRILGTLSSPPYNIPYKVAVVIAHTACFQRRLPIGAPTSPVISNMVAAHLDNALLKMSRRYQLYYTRYADDLTFSTDHARRIESIFSKGTDGVWQGELVDIITHAGFALNPSKTRISSAKERQTVTGLIVNRFPNKIRHYIDEVRGALKSWESYGYQSACAKFNALNGTTDRSLHEYVKGKLAHLCDVRGRNDVLFCRLMTRFSYLSNKPYRCHETLIDRFLDSILIVHDEHRTEIGTAFLLKGHGIVTCNHVASAVSFVSHWKSLNKLHIANISKTSELHDIAVLTSPTFPLTKHVHLDIQKRILGHNDKYRFAGFPNYNGTDPPSVLSGRIVNKTKLFAVDYYKIDKLVYDGASGSPLVCDDYKVAGIIVRGLGADHAVGDTDTNLGVFIHYLNTI